jgi:hypothetical protein
MSDVASPSQASTVFDNAERQAPDRVVEALRVRFPDVPSDVIATQASHTYNQFSDARSGSSSRYLSSARSGAASQPSAQRARSRRSFT